MSTQNQKLLVAHVVGLIESIKPEASVQSALETLLTAYRPDAAVEITLPSSLKEEIDAFWNTKSDDECATAPVEAEEEQVDPKLAEFIDLLKVRGYFNGVEPGSEEYSLRMKKAINKFNIKQNPYANMSPEEIKAKGNAHMIAGKYDDAFECYTKAIEVAMQSSDESTRDESTNLHVYYANRAASLIELKKYAEATEDCEKSISHKPDYPKAFARLGVARYYLSEFEKSADAYERAFELDAGNEKYRLDMEDARSKASEAAKKTEKPNFMQNFMGGDGAAGGADPFSAMLGNPQMKEMMESMGNMGGGGLPDLSGAMANMASNPQFMEMAQSFMQNPQFSNMVQGFAQQFMQGNGSNPMMPGLADMQKMFDPSQAGLDSDALRELQENEVMKNPKMRAISEDVRKNGPAVFSKYMNDPEVMEILKKFGNLFQNNANPQQ